ncbi:WecB/TagA/CpsF family glycosyltransferase [Azospirillum sp. Vi22]|uniref:WecB/TagA/CpsF family glycosyltransferase n=1 Tax=Azospirillum baldaniorum TaxID=1064539 RepID=UPI00157A4E5A|nr:WecB/TagA/CpsF family glycosyltransferase [Azospirillum baldaniorum]NUB08137.1 WecB/TagA/CpsF family glycosyltransferase [Azospirillum baldaniorum]
MTAPQTEPEREHPSDTVFGVAITRLDVAGAARAIAGRAPGEPFAYVVTPNAQHVVRLHRGDDARFRAAYDGAWLRLCDSQIMRHLSRRLFRKPLPSASGSDLTAHLFAHVITPDDTVTVIGGNDELERRLRDRFGLTRLARHEPPMGFSADPREIERCVRFVLDHPARFVFLAVGAPQSECLSLAIRNTGQATGVGLCVGSSLLFVTGLVERAPPLFRRLALEWLYRLAQNPRGHARRVFVDSLPLLGIALSAWWSEQRGQARPKPAARP